MTARVQLSPNSRFSLLENPNVHPGHCALCGHAGGDGRKFIDFGKTVDFFGAIIFCEVCVSELAAAIGFVQSLQIEELQTRYSEAEQILSRHIVELTEEINAARILLRNCKCPPRGSDSGDSNSEPKASKTTSRSKRSNSGTDKASSVEGSSSIHGDAGDGDSGSII